MDNPTAVCYVASEGYLFQTIVSAVQARRNSPVSTEVVIAHLGDDGGEVHDFRRVAAEHRIAIHSLEHSDLGGLHISFGRLLLDRLLPAGIEEILYLDGDTQVVGDLSPLLRATPPSNGLIGVLDPMVFIRETSPRFMKKVDGWWDDAMIPPADRARYINSGVLRVSRNGLASIRERVLAMRDAQVGPLPFPDQDLINRAISGRMRTASIEWNFPGFLLDSYAARTTRPRIVHFMSEPRPWDAPLPPWGATWSRPYDELMSDYPETAHHRRRPGRVTLLRYRAQQRYKQLTERRLWERPHSREAFDRYRAASGERVTG